MPMDDLSRPTSSMPFLRRVAQLQKIREQKARDPRLLSEEEARAKDWFQMGRRTISKLLRDEHGKNDYFNIPYSG